MRRKIKKKFQKSLQEVTLDNERAKRLTELKKMNLTVWEYRNELKKIYDLPDAVLNYMTGVHFKNS
jgi:hypothetical protein